MKSRKRSRLVCLAVTVVATVVVLVKITEEPSSKATISPRQFLGHVGINLSARVPPIHRSGKPTNQGDHEAVRKSQDARRHRLLCWVPAPERELNKGVKAVNETWIPRCDKHLYFVKTNMTSHDVVTVDAPEAWNELTKKTSEVFQYLHKHYSNDFDWFFRADVDTYVIVENLRLLLSKYDPETPVYVGQLFDWMKPGYMSGGGGYALSKTAVKLLVENGYQKGVCPLTEGHSDDVHLGRCLHRLGVGYHNSLDIYGRESFHQYSPFEMIIKNNTGLTNKYATFKQYGDRNCCSEATISFHHVSSDNIRIWDQLLYNTYIYGRVQDDRYLESLIQPKEVYPRNHTS